MVYSDTYSCLVFLADVEERDQTRAYLFNLLGVFLVCIFQFLEGTGSVYIVARIDAYLFYILGGYIRYVGVEVYIGNQWSVVSLRTQTDVDVLHVFGFAHSLGSEAYIFSSCIDDAFGLFYTSFCIQCDGIRHTLDTYRIGATHRGSANVYFC